MGTETRTFSPQQFGDMRHLRLRDVPEEEAARRVLGFNNDALTLQQRDLLAAFKHAYVMDVVGKKVEEALDVMQGNEKRTYGRDDLGLLDRIHRVVGLADLWLSSEVRSNLIDGTGYIADPEKALDPKAYKALQDHIANEAASADAVNHPQYYTRYKGLEIIDLVEQMNYNRGNAVKYIARAGFKDPDTKIQDLEKAAWYINREIERVKKYG